MAVSSDSDVGTEVREALFQRLDEVEECVPVAEKDQSTMALIPAPLCDKPSGSLAALPWKRMGRAIKYVDVAEPEAAVTARLMLLSSSSALLTSCFSRVTNKKG